MGIMPVRFEVVRNSVLPILRVTGVIKNIHGVERFLLSKTVEIIEVFEKYKGKLMESNSMDDMSNIEKDMIAVRFYIIFKDEKDLTAAISGITKALG